MFDEFSDLDPKTKRIKPRNLDNLSIDDLKAYINDLENEIIRVKLDIDKKQAHINAAASLFKKKGD